MSKIKARNGKIEDLWSGKIIKLKELQLNHIEYKAIEFIENQDENWEYKGKNKEYWLEYFRKNAPKIKKWSDYAIYLINAQTTNWIRENWIAKTKTSIKHWKNTGSALNENIRDAALVLSDTKDLYFSEYKEDYTKKIWWDQVGLTEISRKPIIKFFIYPEDSVENQARYYINQLVSALKGKNEELKERALKELYNNKTLRSLMFGENGTMEELKELPESLKYNQLPWCAQKDIKNIPTGKDAREIVLGNSRYRKVEKERESCDLNIVIEALENGGKRYFHDELRSSANWKRIVVAVLRNDVNFTYLSFSPSAEQMAIRSEGLAAFSQTKEDREKALEEFKKLQEKAKKEKEENSKL